jgi:hypothetical protein
MVSGKFISKVPRVLLCKNILLPFYLCLAVESDGDGKRFGSKSDHSSATDHIKHKTRRSPAPSQHEQIFPLF